MHVWRDGVNVTLALIIGIYNTDPHSVYMSFAREVNVGDSGVICRRLLLL